MAIIPREPIIVNLSNELDRVTIETVRRSALIFAGSVVQDGAAVDITGTTPSVVIGPADGEWSISSTGTVTDAAGGLFEVEITETQIDTYGTFEFDLQLADDDGSAIHVYGDYIVKNRAADDSSGTAPTGSVRDYSATSSFLAVDGSGPYTEGVGIAFGTANADGQVPITLTGGAGGNIEDSTTAETDTTKIIQPDGVGGVAWVADTGGGHIIEDDGTPLTQRESLNFSTHLTATDNAGTDATDITTDATDANTASAIVARDANGVTILSGLQLDTAASPGDSVGQIRWNDTDKCIEYNTDNGTTIQVGQELGVYARNSTGSAIDNGAACYVSGATGNRPTVALANADAELTADTTIGLCTGTAGILNNADGFITTFGLVRGLNTLGLTEGGDIYLSDSVAGTWTQTEPTADASYVVRLGVVTRAHATLGEVLVNVTSRGTVIAENFRHAGTEAAARAVISAAEVNSLVDISPLTDGLAYDKPVLDVVETTGQIFLQVEKLGGGDIRFIIGGVISTLDCTTATGVGGKAIVQLTAGADANTLARNFIYATDTGGVANLVATTARPTGAFAWVGEVSVADADTVAVRGPEKLQRYTESENNSRGQISNEREKIRSLFSTWDSGAAPSLNIVTNGGAEDAMDFQTTEAKVYQLHLQTCPAFTTGPYQFGNGADIYTTATLTAADIWKTSDGSAIASGRRANFIVWGTVNQDSGLCRLYINLPTSSYINEAQAIADTENSADYSVPSELRSVAFMIGRYCLRYQNAAGGTWAGVGASVYDLRGTPPGSRTGGAGAVASNEFADSLFRIFDDGDDTRQVALELSGVATETTRTLTVPDKDGTLALTDDVLFLVSGEDYLLQEGQEIIAQGINADNMAATGTPDATTFLRGDNTWATPAGGGGGGDPQELILAASTFVGPLATGATDDCGYVSSDIAASAESGIGVTTGNATQQSKDYLITVTPPSGWTSWATLDCLEFRCWAGSNSAANCEVSFLVEDGTNTYLSSLLNTFTTADTPQTYAFDTADLTTGTLPAGPFQIRVTLWTANDFETIFSQVIVRGA